MNILIKDNPVVSIILSFQDRAKLAYVFKKPVAQGEFFAALGSTFGRMGIEMPALEIPPQPGMKVGYKYNFTMCPDCGLLFPENVIIRHLKSGCKYGNGKRIPAKGGINGINQNQN